MVYYDVCLQKSLKAPFVRMSFEEALKLHTAESKIEWQVRVSTVNGCAFAFMFCGVAQYLLPHDLLRLAHKVKAPVFFHSFPAEEKRTCVALNGDGKTSAMARLILPTDESCIEVASVRMHISSMVCSLAVAVH